MIEAARGLAEKVGVQPACAALGLPRATYYRRTKPCEPRSPRPEPPLKLAPGEVEAVLEVLHSPRFVDSSPRQIWATLLDEDQRYLCSVRTMYRILESRDELRERRDQLRHPKYTKPELLATQPNEVWSWDITKLRGPRKGVWYHLYVLLDIFSRCVLGWLVAQREESSLARELIRATLEKQGIPKDSLTIHADRGPSMTSKSVALLLSDLGVNQSHNRPYTSNDNPFSEAQFKTVKYHPSYPERFGSLEAAREFFGPLFAWYNKEHRHTGLALLTPADVHYGRAEAILAQRAVTLNRAFTSHPSRFKGQAPKTGVLPEEVWINPPVPEPDSEAPRPETPGAEQLESPNSGSAPATSAMAAGESPGSESDTVSPSCLLGWDERRLSISCPPEASGSGDPAGPAQTPRTHELAH